MSGKLGSASLAANQDTVLYTVPANTVATVNIALVNGGATEAKVKVALSSGANPVDEDYITINRALAVSGEYERSGIALSAGEKIIVRSDVAGVVVRVHGFVEGA